MDLAKYEKIFAQESERYLKELDELLMQVEIDLLNRDLWVEIHGKLHSIKGMAKALSMDHISRLTHCMENWTKGFQQEPAAATRNAVRCLFEGADILRLLVERKDKPDTPENQSWYDRLLSEFTERSPEDADEIQDQKAGPSSSTPAILPIGYVKVRYALIEELLGMSQEFLFSEKTLPPLSQKLSSPVLKGWVEHYTSSLKGLYFRLTQLRLMSIGDFCELFSKPVRNMADEYDKKVRLEIVGSELQADMGLLDRLREPLIHVLRNCVAHGIEAPPERVNSGKNQEGIITLQARSETDSLVLTIEDDGRGIDREAISKYLKDKRTMTAEQIGVMSDEELLSTLCSPEFTTAQQTTDMSGRGIGMNLVAQAIKYLGGRMSIASEPLKGTRLTFRLPVSLSVIYAVTFQVGGYTLSVPTSRVSSIETKKGISEADRGAYCDLGALLGIDSSGKDFFNILDLKRAGGENGVTTDNGHFKLIVNRIIGNRPLMIMPLGELLAKVRLFTGVGIMENGDVSILLDTECIPGLADL